MNEKNIAYKVVGKRNRFGSNMNLFLKEEGFGPKKFNMWVDKHKTIWNRIGRYFPKYSKGSIVKAVRGSVGIMCFKSPAEAEYFIEIFSLGLNRCRIIKVMGIGKKKKVSKIINMRGANDWGWGINLSNLVKKEKFVTDLSYEIISFPSVKVLE